jgi:RNA polymerase sigma-70 factor (ECF subfamily)
VSQSLVYLPLVSGSTDALERARAAWPKVRVERDVFLRYLAERTGNRSHGPVPNVHVEDLYLACGCAVGDSHALAELESRFFPEVGAYVRTIDPAPEFADEVRQVLRAKLLVRDGDEPPRIAEYTGRGPLAGWLRVASIRAAHDLQRKRKRFATLDTGQAGRLRSRGPDPEVAYVMEHYGREFRDAFQKTLSALPARERNILSLYFLDGMTSEAIGVFYRVHGSTVRVWIKRLRTTILDETRRRLRERLAVGRSELDSVMRAIRSDMDVSISRYLKRPEG